MADANHITHVPGPGSVQLNTSSEKCFQKDGCRSNPLHPEPPPCVGGQVMENRFSSCLKSFQFLVEAVQVSLVTIHGISSPTIYSQHQYSFCFPKSI